MRSSTSSADSGSNGCARPLRSRVATKRDSSVGSSNRLTQSPRRTQRVTENEIARQILDAAFIVHTKLGPGLLESVYDVVLAYELQREA